jgi:hypothetical protein|nr:MAG TPA: hypothetical protein [Caudoviricetes sp.]
MIKIIEKHDFKDRTFKKLYKVNSLEELKNLKIRDDMRFYYKGVELDLNNPVLPAEPTTQDKRWNDLKNKMTNMNIFEFIENIHVVFEINEYFFRLDEHHRVNGKDCIEMVLDAYTEEAIVYVVDSCYNGVINGNFKVVPVRELENAEEILHRPERRRNELEYKDWKNNIYDMIAHDFRSNNFYESIAMEGLIKELEKKDFKARINKTIDYLKLNNDVIKYAALSFLQENSISVELSTNGKTEYFSDVNKIPYRELIIYKNIPIDKIKIHSLNYDIVITKENMEINKNSY